MAGTLYYGDNLSVLRDSIPDDSVDLIYLDPPFNSNATYNVLFKAPSGHRAGAQLQAFEDTWSWGEEAEAAYAEVLRSSSPVAGILRALRSFLGQNDMMAYLAMMTVRLTQLRRVLKDSGSLYLHCDPTASHYLKVILDGIFGAANFRNEIVWQRSAPKGHAHRRFASSHDILLFYSKGDQPKWRPQHLPHREEYVASHYANVEEGSGRRYMLDNCLNPNPDRPNLTYDWNGHHRVWRWTRDKMQDLHDSGRIAYTKTGMPRYKRYLDEMSGTPVSSVWTDIPPVNSQAKERLGYPTQKPLALLERIIHSATDDGDVVLDPFCGCGTAIHAAERLGRHWLGIDVTHLAIQVIEDRLRYHFPALTVPVIGRPTDLEGARDLAARDKYQFQWWATWLVGGAPRGGRKKGADHGVDGDLYFMTDRDRDAHAVISVKGGQRLGPAFVRDLRGVREREGADLALLICLEEPTEEMRREAASGGFFETTSLQLPRIQILTVADLLTSGAGIRAPTYDTVTAAQAARRRKTAKPPRRPSPDQRELLLPLPPRPDDTTASGLNEPTAPAYATPSLVLPPFLRARLKIAV